MIGTPHGLQDGLIHPLSKFNLLSFSPLLTQLKTFNTNICNEAQYWEEVKYGAQYLYPQACLVDQRYHGIIKLICSI